MNNLYRNGIAFIVFAMVVMTGQNAVADSFPIFDAHLHYNKEVWEKYSPAEIVKILRKARVIGGIISSTPNEGTLKLIRDTSLPQQLFLVPVLRPYGNGVTKFNWHKNDEGLYFTEETIRNNFPCTLERGSNPCRIYKGIGEVHVPSSTILHSPQVGRYLDIILRYDMMLYVHSVAFPVEFLFKKEPKLRILWAHAGRIEKPEVLDQMLSKYPRSQLMVELSLRADSILDYEGNIKSSWKELFIKHSDRFMIGTDTHSVARWENYGALIEQHRVYLRQLPYTVARAIAYRNAFYTYSIGPELK